MVIVTGANGFIGSAFVWELERRGRRGSICVDAVSRAERAGPLGNRAIGDFVLRDDLWDFLETPAARQVEWVVHMGACSSTTEMDVAFLRENNTLYTQRLWEWCARRGLPFIYASSGAVYGDGALGFDDAAPPAKFHALNPYGESKLAFDRWAVQQAPGAASSPPHWYGLRFFNVFGPNEYHKGDMASVVFKAFGQIRETGQLRLFRSHRPDFLDGEQKRDFVYVKDVVSWMAEIMEKKPASGIYNMGFGAARSWNDLAASAFAAIGAPSKIEWIDVPLEMRPRYQYFTEAKIGRLLAAGLSDPQWSLERGVADYIGNYLKRPTPYL
jgi:ADP-L-glycero-D-manno-heptose 6-epimerase